MHSMPRFSLLILPLLLLLGSQLPAQTNDVPVGYPQISHGSWASVGESAYAPVRLPPVAPVHTLWPGDHALPLAATPVTDANVEAVSYAFADGCLPAEKPGFGLGSFRVVPYGAFWADMIYASRATVPGAFTLWVASREVEGEGRFTIDARRSRFGFNVAGPNIPYFDDAASSGQLEIDFQGDFVIENRASVLLRHAYWQVKNDRYRLLVGQYWDVISPLIPHTVNYSVGWTAGNIGFRRTQFRAERYLNVSDNLLITLQGSLNQDIVPDFPTDPGIRREPTDWPVIEGRIAMTLGQRNACVKPVTVGVSGHVGETGFDFLTPGPPPLSLPPEDDARFKEWSFNVDVYLPISERMGFQGEFFTGANLSAFLGGIGQGVCPCVRKPIRSTGGWAEIWYDFTPYLHGHIGAGIDDPNNNDSLLGRTYNHFIFANVMYDITDKLVTGFEVTSWKTLYQEERAGLIPPSQLTPSAPGEAITLDWMIKYGF
jgi:hypothetical protein